MRDPKLVRSLGRAVLLGGFSGVFALAYLFVVEEGIHALWPEWDDPEWFSGKWQMVVFPIVAGLIVGVIYKVMRLPARFKGFIGELEEGQVEPSTAPGAVLIAFVSLIGGASLGPEAPLGTAGGAAGTWLARRRGGDEADVRTATFTGMSGMFGGLLSTPIGGPLLAFELEHHQTHDYYLRELVPGVLAGAVSFGIMWPLIGAPFIDLYGLPGTEFRSWMLLAGIAIGLVGVVAALVVGKIMVLCVELMRRADGNPILRGLTAGAVLAAIAFIAPLTLFSGTDGLVPVFEHPAALGVGTLVVLALLKAIALGTSLGGGFYGGPIFPTFFIGGALGAAIHVAIPEIPLALAAGGMMAAIGGAIALIPLSMAIIAALIVQADFVLAGAIVMAAFTSFAVRKALTKTVSEGAAQVASADAS